MLSFIYPLLYLICATGFLVLISKRTFGKCLPVTMMLSAFSYFVSQALFKTFKVGFAINQETKFKGNKNKIFLTRIFCIFSHFYVYIFVWYESCIFGMGWMVTLGTNGKRNDEIG